MRLKNYNYSKTGYYFVTICANNRKYIFGDIEDDKMILNLYGKIIKNTWLEIPKHLRNVELDAYVVMPNHIHGIIIINSPVGYGHARTVKTNNNLSNIIGSFKSAATRKINQLSSIHFKWQRFFYDHIIRTEKSLNNIREYITNNPTTWNNDENNTDNYRITGQACLTPTEEGAIYEIIAKSRLTA